jgi:D-tyrosyl-tRNA(Tyr) deacylase
MRAVVQRVASASVAVDGAVVGSIDAGFLVLLGVGRGDTAADADAIAAKIAGLRVFSDDAGRMNLDVIAVGGAVLLVSQFTLLADVRKGRRPSFVDAADPVDAVSLVDRVADGLRGAGVEVSTGVFGAHMEVSLINDGPVTIIVETVDGTVQ